MSTCVCVCVCVYVFVLVLVFVFMLVLVLVFVLVLVLVFVFMLVLVLVLCVCVRTSCRSLPRCVVQVLSRWWVRLCSLFSLAWKGRTEPRQEPLQEARQGPGQEQAVADRADRPQPLGCRA